MKRNRKVRCSQCLELVRLEFYSDLDKGSDTYLVVWCIPCGMDEEVKVNA